MNIEHGFFLTKEAEKIWGSDSISEHFIDSAINAKLLVFPKTGDTLVAKKGGVIFAFRVIERIIFEVKGEGLITIALVLDVASQQALEFLKDPPEYLKILGND